MRSVVLVGDFTNGLDEGYKNVAHYLADALTLHVRVERVNNKRLLGRTPLSRLLLSRPTAFHVLAQPTLAALLLVALLRVLHPRTLLVVSALRAEAFGSLPQRVLVRSIAWTSESLIVVAPDESGAARFRALGVRTTAIPNGVDLERFKALPAAARAALREQLGIAPDDFVALHVGHLVTQRNLDWLIPLANHGFQVVVVASTYMGVDERLRERLELAGVRLVIGYSARVEEYYQAADCYVFPVHAGDTLSVPLSILEARASGLAVVAQPFPALAQVLASDPDVRLVRSAAEMTETVDSIARQGRPLAAPPLPAAMGWKSIAARMAVLYGTLR